MSTDSVIENVTSSDGFNNFFDLLTDAATVVTLKLVEVAPDVAQGLLNLIQIKGIFSIGRSVLLLLGILGLFTLMYKKVVPWVAQKEEKVNYDYSGLPTLFFLFVPYAIMGFIFISQLVSFLSFYHWIAAFYPEGAIALKALEAAGINL